MIDFTRPLSWLFKYFDAFPLWYIINGQAYRWYDSGEVSNTTPARYRIELPTDKSVFLFFRELNVQKDNVAYRVFVGGDSSGGTEITSKIRNKNTHFNTNPSSDVRIWKGVTFSGTMEEVDYEPLFGQTDQGTRTSGGFILDNNARIYAPNDVIFVELSTLSSAATQSYKLEYQWAEV